MKAGRIIYRLEVAFKPVFQCNRCSRKQQGDTLSVALHGPFSPEQVPMLLADMRASNSAMPVGWQGNGSDQHLCQNCHEGSAP
jgi:hypothetical protein